MKSLKHKIPDLLQIGVSTVLCSVFCAPLFGLVAPGEEPIDENGEKTTRCEKIISNFIAVLCGAGTMFLLNSIFGKTSGLPRIGNYTITNTERLWGIPLAAIGAIFGILFIVFEKISHRIFSKLKKVKNGQIISTTLSGLILGIIGTYFPLVMFSGEESITKLQETYKGYAPWVLLAIGIIKLLITNICIQSGWRGGHFFPVIFCGISIGFSTAMLSGLDISFCAAVITAGLLGATIKKPLAVTFLLMLCFDIRIAVWILAAAFIGSLISAGAKQIAIKSNRIENTV